MRAWSVTSAERFKKMDSILWTCRLLCLEASCECITVCLTQALDNVGLITPIYMLSYLGCYSIRVDSL